MFRFSEECGVVLFVALGVGRPVFRARARLVSEIARASQTLAGPAAVERGYVYWTDAKRLPNTDLATIELLWRHYSDERFGFVQQRNVWRVQKGIFDKFCAKIAWSLNDEETGLPRKRKWFGNSEFIYDKSAPKGHLPLTSALRGTQLLKALLAHEVWDTAWERKLVEV